tara:strand:+ start:293 stop:427 length:135 start_codon:yes stop_codon:yes gene_type:complete
MWQMILKELALLALRGLVKYAENEITKDTVDDVAKRCGKEVKQA